VRSLLVVSGEHHHVETFAVQLLDCHKGSRLDGIRYQDDRGERVVDCDPKRSLTARCGLFDCLQKRDHGNAALLEKLPVADQCLVALHHAHNTVAGERLECVWL
jgi:hypothetical protein